MNMKKVIVISTSLCHGSNSDMLAENFIEGAFCGGVNDAREIESNPKLQEAYELGKSIG